MAKASVSTEVSAIGVDLGDRRCQVCVLDREGAVVEEALGVTGLNEDGGSERKGG